jgi:hypothetical protein
MAPSPCAEPLVGEADAELLLDIAEAAIISALRGRQPKLPPLGILPSALHRRAGVFVTLTVAGSLNGCIGTIEGVEPVGHAVALLALSAAFADQRLPALRPADYAHLTIEISLLSPPSPLEAASRAQLVGELRPGQDGLIIEAGTRRGLFLPSVWEQLPRREDFLDQLWLKAGLAPRTWPSGLRAFRFETERHERVAGGARGFAA